MSSDKLGANIKNIPLWKVELDAILFDASLLALFDLKKVR